MRVCGAETPIEKGFQGRRGHEYVVIGTYIDVYGILLQRSPRSDPSLLLVASFAQWTIYSNIYSRGQRLAVRKHIKTRSG